MRMRYLEDVITLEYDASACIGCRQCVLVCPHRVFEMHESRAALVDRGACMECGACALNCAGDAITLKPGVGCAAAILQGWIKGTEPSCDCDCDC